MQRAFKILCQDKTPELGKVAAQKLHLMTLNDFKVKSLKLRWLQGFFYDVF